MPFFRTPLAKFAVGACITLAGCKSSADAPVCLGERELGVAGDVTYYCRTERSGILRAIQWRVVERELNDDTPHEILLVRAGLLGGPGAPVLVKGRLVDDERSYEILVEGRVVISNRYPHLVLLR